MTHYFGPMSSSPDGIDRVELQVPFRVSRDDIVTIVAEQFPHKAAMPTKAEIFDAVQNYLHIHGTEGLEIAKRVEATFHSERLLWAEGVVAKHFSGWNYLKAS